LTRGQRFFLLGLACAIVAVVLFVLSRRPAGDPLTEEALAAARKRWSEHGLRDYTLEIERLGAQQDHCHIEVKGGVVASMTVDGEPVGERVREQWSVEGIFVFLAEELSNRAHPEVTFGVSDPEQVVLRASFDPEYGYPRRFLRHVIGQRRSVEWEIVAFSPGG